MMGGQSAVSSRNKIAGFSSSLSTAYRILPAVPSIRRRLPKLGFEDKRPRYHDLIFWIHAIENRNLSFGRRADDNNAFDKCVGLFIIGHEDHRLAIDRLHRLFRHRDDRL